MFQPIYHVVLLVPVNHPIAQYCRYYVTKKFTLSNSAVMYMLQSLVNGRLRVQLMSQQLRNPCVITVANLSIITDTQIAPCLHEQLSKYSFECDKNYIELLGTKSHV